MRSAWRPCAIAGALSIVTYGLALYALSLGPTAPLAALRETGMVTALMIAIVFLKERVTASRVVAVLGILGGAVLILAAKISGISCSGEGRSAGRRRLRCQRSGLRRTRVGPV